VSALLLDDALLLHKSLVFSCFYYDSHFTR